MKAAVFEGNGRLVLKDRLKPTTKHNNDVLIKVTGVGICGTDLHILQVPPAHPAKIGGILGHEFTGEIVEVGSEVSEYDVGDSVIVDPHPGCGLCEKCRMGKPDQCKNLYTSVEPGHPNTIGIFSDGAFAEYVVVPAHALYKIDSNVPPYYAALAEPLSCVISALKKVEVRPGMSAVVLGAGPIGLLFASLLKANGVTKIFISEISSYRKIVAAECGIEEVLDPNEIDIVKYVKKQTNGGADIVIEAVGPLLDQAIELVKTGGNIIQFGHDELAKPPIPLGEIVRNEITIHGAFIGKFSFDTVKNIIESGVLPLDKIVSHRLPLSKIHEGLELLRKGKAIKVIILPNG